MKIAVVVNEFPRLSETFIYTKVLELAKRENQLFVLCTSLNKEFFKTIFKGNANIKPIVTGKRAIIRHLVSHPYQLIKTKKNNLYFLQFLAAVNSIKPDILHFEFSGIGVRYLHTFHKINAKKIVSCRGTAEKITLPANEARQQNIKMLFDLTDAIHCVSNDIKQAVIPYCSKPKKIFINHAAVDTEKFKRTGTSAIAGPLVILTVGRLTFQKGYFTGLLAIKKLIDLNNNFHWLIAGSGPQEEEILFHINEMQLNNYVTLTGAKKSEEIIELYNQADIYFFPSVAEGLGNVALEAMSMELPVVSTRSGGIQEVIEHGIDGLLVDVYDITALAEHLLLLLNNEQLRISMGKAARKKIVQHFNIEQQIDKFESVYKSLVQNKTLQ